MPEREPPFVGVVTHNPMATLRFELLEATVRSIEKAFPSAKLFLLDNGSTDGSWEAVCELLGPRQEHCKSCADACQRQSNKGVLLGYPPRGRWHVLKGRGAPQGNFTPGAGRHRLYWLMRPHFGEGDVYVHPEFWVWSDDDIIWHPDSETTLRSFYAAAERPVVNIAILSGLLEPVWHWNTPRETVEVGGVKVLVRDSAPGAAWTFATHRQLPELLLGGTPGLMRFGYDYECCKGVREIGGRVAQIDLAEHIGWGYSTHGNDADEHGRPLDREKWGV